MLKIVVLGMVVLAAGCASPRYKPAAYKAAQDRFGAIVVQTGKQLYVCPAIDSLTPAARRNLAPDFTPWTFVTEALESELRASGLEPRRPAFPSGPGFEALRKTVASKANPDEQAVFLATELLALTPWRWTLDVQLLSSRGDLLFAKRGLCAIWSGPFDEQQLIHMTLRQILADPDFLAALQ